MRPLVLSTTFWVLLAVALFGMIVTARGGHFTLRRVVELLERRSIILLLLLGGAVNLTLRVTAGYINPRDFVQDYVAASEFMAGRSLYPEDLPAIGAEAVANSWFPAKSILEQNPVFRGEFSRLGETAPGNAHPPIMGVVLGVPAELLGLRGTYILMVVVLLVLFAWSMRTILRQYGLRLSASQWLVLVGLLAGWHPLNAAIRSAQPGILLLGLIVGGWVALRSGRNSVGGALIGLAACIQAFPLLLVGYLAVRRPIAFASAIATIILVNLAISGITPPGTNAEWGETMAWIAPAFVGVPENLSLTGLTIRTARTLGTELDSTFVAFGWIALSVLWAVVTLLPGRWTTRSREVLDLEVSLVVALMLLLSPLTWTRYLPLLLFPVITILVRLDERLDSHAKVGWLLTSLLVLSIPDGTAVLASEALQLVGGDILSLIPVGSMTLAIGFVCGILALHLRRTSPFGQVVGVRQTSVKSSS